MTSVCIVGLPTQLRARLEAVGRRNGITLASILAGPGKEGVLWLLPHPREVKSLIHRYVDGLESYADGQLVVLPYVSMLPDVDEEIDALQSIGAQVTRVQAGADQWPLLESDREFNEPFREKLFAALVGIIAPGEVRINAPSDHFIQVCARTPALLLGSTVLRRCDAVAPERHQFMRDAADAFEILLRGHPGVPLEQFFAARGLEHAQSGPIVAKVTFQQNGREVLRASTETHLKEGDATTRAGAARIYYHYFEYGAAARIAVLHAGPHPDRSFNVVIDLDASG